MDVHRLAQEKFEAGLSAFESADYQQAVDSFLMAADLYKGIKEKEENYARCLTNAANALNTLGQYKKAESLLNQAILLQKKILELNHPDIATSFNNLANIYYEQGEYAKAKEFYEKALAIREKSLGSEHPDVAASFSNLATIYAEQGEYDKAREFFEKALAIREKSLGSKHPDVAASFNNLANTYYEQGEYAKAKEFHEKALAIREKSLGSEHPDVAASFNNLATIYAEQGEYAKAKEFYEKALAIREKVLGHEHPDTANSLNNLAVLNKDLGNFEEAKKLNEEALAIREEKLGTEHPDIYQSFHNLSDVILAQNSNNSIEHIAQLHETVLQFFLQEIEKNSFYFTLRTVRNDEQGRLSKGYWFLGDEESLYFSFWKGIDNTNQMPTITLTLDIQQQLTVTFNGQDSPEKAEFLQDLTQLFDDFTQITHEKRWKKTYSQDWQNALETFLSDKAQIDDYLAVKGGKIEDFTFIPENEFKQSLKFVDLLRSKLRRKEIKQLTETGKPLKLHSLALENIGHFENLSIDLSRQVTILIGENGSGKSTILKAIALALSGKAKTLSVELMQDYLRILKTDEYGIKHFCKKGSIHLNLHINTVQSQIIEFNNTELGGVGIEISVDNKDEWLLASDNRFIDLVLGFPQGKKRNSKSLGNIVDPNLNDIIDLIEERDISKWKADLVEWIVALYREPETEIREKNLEQIQWVFDIFSKIIADNEPNAIRLKSAVHDPATGKKDIIICTPDMPEGISLDLLSQGYTNIFIWVGRLVMRLYAALSAHQFEQAREKHLFLRNPNTRGKRYDANTIQELHGIVLIDEVDTYLHPQWQRNILRVLADIFPCLQFIVTSHSMTVLSSLKNKENYYIYRAVKEQNHVAFIKIDPVKENPYGADLNTVADDFMDFPEREPEIKDKLETLRSAIARKQIEAADSLILELEAEINPEDEELNKLKSRLDAKKLIVGKT